LGDARGFGKLPVQRWLDEDEEGPWSECAMRDT
jgi:hypothetical protein